MLVLSRREQQSINLRRGDELIEIYVLRAADGRAKVGIKADGKWNIARSEVDRYAHGKIQAGPEDMADLGQRTSCEE